MDAAERRLAAVRDAIEQLEPKLGGIAVQLWDGSTVPAVLPPDAVIIQLKDEGTVAALMKRPLFDTIIRLYALNRLELAAGNFFGLAAKRSIAQPRELLTAIGPKRLARAAALFLRVPSGQLRLPGETDVDGEEDRPAAHHDLPERFFALFLDPEMVYSCAYFPAWDADLATAQIAKLDHVCRKLRLKPGDRLLDVGCGWGALICHAAKHYGVTAHGITLSEQQRAYTEDKIRREGLQGRVTVAIDDWTTVEGPFDKIASVGMFEHVPLARHGAYFDRIRSLLPSRGLYLHHAITRRGRVGNRSSESRADYRALLRHIFPGAEVDQIGSTLTGLEHSGFEVHDVEALREHYARTTEIWCRRLLAAREAATAEVGDPATRLWIAYLAGVSLAFRRGTIGVFQTLVSARGKGASGLPPTRADLYVPTADAGPAPLPTDDDDDDLADEPADQDLDEDEAAEA